ncbi:hypothetical protein [Helicobacter bilis]|uniref:hypothetical protein n=1 Tax=Helicobacter bilis TaxID=37372 RepID=UPI00248F4074|nr:hypothetical protein [Helicobacter bilis]
MWKLLENIGLGLFVNALYSVFTSNINGAVIATMSASVVYYGGFNLFSKEIV